MHPADARPIVVRVAPPIIEQRVSPSGLAYRTHTSRAGADARVFVLLHGIGMSFRYLSKLHRELEPHGTVITFDLPGFGGTPKPAEPVTVEQYAELVGQALTRIGVRECVIVGHSMGCQFAVELARQLPALPSHVVLIGPVVDARRRTVIQQALALGRDGLREPPSVNAVTIGDYLRCGPRWYLTELREMMAYPTEKRITDLAAPTLVIRGERDPVAGRQWSAALAARAPHGRILEISGHRHVVQHSAAAQVADAVVAFVESSRPAGHRL